MNVRRSTVSLVAACLAGAGLLVACGSQVPPDAFLNAQGALGMGSNVPVGSASTGALPASGGASGVPTLANGTSVAAGPRGHAGGPVVGTSGAPSSRTSGNGGSHGSNTGHGGESPKPSGSATRSTHSSAPAPAACEPPTATKPTVVVCPSTGLRDGQTVHVYASGFQNAKRTGLMPAALVVTECADKGNNTQQGDCGDLHFVNPDSSGNVSITITVDKVVGSNKVVCGQQWQCLVSVAQPKQPPDYEADQHIHFA